MSVRKTIKWLVLIVVVIGVAGGGFGYWKWSTLNRELLRTVREQFAEVAPGWNIQVESARFDWHRRIHLYNLSLQSSDGSPLLRIPEVILVVDQDKLADSQIFDVQRIRILRPELHLTRDAQGTWNWEKLPRMKKASKPTQILPEIVVEAATVQVRLKQADGNPDSVIELKQGSLKLVPKSRRQFLVQGDIAVRDAGQLTVNGDWNFHTGEWSFDGRMQNIDAGGELLALAVGTSPELRANVARLEARLRKLTPSAERSRTAVNADAHPNFGASAIVDVSFHVAKKTGESEPQFDLHAKFRDGHIHNPALPVELHDLEGNVHWSNDIVEIRDVTAKSGTLRLWADVKIRRLGEATPIRIRFRVTNLPMNEKLEKRLPTDWQPYYRKVNPQGRISVSGTLEYDGLQEWTPLGCVLTTHDCSFAHADFPYRFTQVNGSATQNGNLVTLNFKGRAGRQPATLTGWVKNPGPQAASRYDLKITGFQLDATFLAACKPSVRKTMKSLGVGGHADVHFTADDPGGRSSVARLSLLANLKDCIVEYDRFPYRLTRFTGSVVYDSRTDVWTFSDLRAINGSATYTGSGYLSEENGKPHLELNITGKKAHLDIPLYRALPKSLQELWSDLSPTGIVDLEIGLKWTEGKPLQISVPKCSLTKGTMTVRSFPYLFENISAKFAYEKPRLRILSFDAKHNETQIRMVGFADVHPGGDWSLRLVKFRADELIPDRTFRRALGKDLQTVLEELDPKGPVSVTGTLHFLGTGRKKDPITAAWKVKLVMVGSTLNFGVKLKDVHGRVFLNGTWDGRIVDMHKGNRFDLDSINVHGYQFTQVKGPFQLYDKTLVVGSPKPFQPRRRGEKPPKIADKEQVMATAIGGKFSLNAVAWFHKETSFKLSISMNRARLEKFARRYLKGAKKLKGEMSGRIVLQGKGKSSRNLRGGGNLFIERAELFELPVLVKIFSVTNLKPADKTAFRFAYADFDIANRKIRFHRIDLVGDTINLRGRGEAHFDGKLAIDFYSMLPRSRLPIFILQQLVRTATSGWVGVKVRGTVANPEAEIQAIPQVDNALKQFLKALGGRPSAVLPRFQPPTQQPRRRR